MSEESDLHRLADDGCPHSGDRDDDQAPGSPPATAELTPAQRRNRDHAELCRLALAGDRDASGRLFGEVMAMAWSLANKYCRVFRRKVSVDDLYSVACLRFCMCLRYYRPAYGGFLNFFTACAAREMVAQCVRESDRQSRIVEDSIGSLVLVPDAEGDTDSLDADEVLECIRDETARVLLSEVSGVSGRRGRALRTVADELGLTTREAERMHAAAFGVASDYFMRHAA